MCRDSLTSRPIANIGEKSLSLNIKHCTDCTTLSFSLLFLFQLITFFFPPRSNHIHIAIAKVAALSPHTKFASSFLKPLYPILVVLVAVKLENDVRAKEEVENASSEMAHIEAVLGIS
jgi:hypothetical protein